MAARHGSYGCHPIRAPARYKAALARAYHGTQADQVAAVALANKIARIAWAMMVHGERFKEPKLLPVAA